MLFPHLVKIRLTAPNARTVQRTQASLTDMPQNVPGWNQGTRAFGPGGDVNLCISEMMLSLKYAVGEQTNKKHDLYATLLRSRSLYN